MELIFEWFSLRIDWLLLLDQIIIAMLLFLESSLLFGEIWRLELEQVINCLINVWLETLLINLLKFSKDVNLVWVYVFALGSRLSI